MVLIAVSTGGWEGAAEDEEKGGGGEGNRQHSSIVVVLIGCSGTITPHLIEDVIIPFPRGVMNDT